MLTVVQTVEFQAQFVAEQLQWAKEVKGVKNPDTLAAYEAGLNQGYRAAISAMSLHGYEFPDPKAA